MPRTLPLGLFRHSSTMALLAVLAIDLSLLAADSWMSAASRPAMRPLLLLLGVGRLAILTLALTAVTVTADQMRMAATLVVTFTFNTICAVLLGQWRGQPETAVVVAVATAMGGAVLIPWGVKSQTTLVVLQMFVVAWGILAFPESSSPATLLVLGVGSMASTIYLTRELARTRARLLVREDENAEGRRRADELHDRLEDRILVRTSHLEEKAAEFEGLCQAASHDLRPPLRTIAGFSEILRESAIKQGRDGNAQHLGRIIEEATTMASRIDGLLTLVRETHRAIAESLVSLSEVAHSQKTLLARLCPGGTWSIATSPGDEALAVLARRATVTLWILLGLGVLATATDFVAAGPSRVPLLALGVARLVALTLILGVLPRVSSSRGIITVAVSGVCVILAVSPPLGLLRDQFATAMMIDCGLCIAAGAFLPWGWKVQLLPVATALVTVVLTLHLYGWGLIAPQSLVMVTSCLAVSVYFAVDHQRVQEELARHDAEIAASNREILDLNRELERRVAEREAMLEDANRRLEAFCESLAQDLGPSLVATHGILANLAVTGPFGDSAESAALVERIERAVVRMEETIHALVRYVALGRVPLRSESVDLSRIAADKVECLRDQNPDRNVEVVIQQGMSVFGDAGLLTEVVGNLLDNAWKFTGGCDQAEVEFGVAEAGDGTTQFVVRDNGVGFEMAHVGNLFRPFTRLEAVGSFPGHGMGLARVARILARHGGTIEAEGVAGEGAEFRFRIPTSSRSETA